MKKASLFLALLLIMPIGFSCYNNSVTIHASNDLERVYAMLLLEQRYNDFVNDSFIYEGLNGDGLLIKADAEYLVLQSSNSSINWSRAIHDELYSLWIYNASSINEEDIIFLSNQGCCGDYNNGIFLPLGDGCVEELKMESKDSSGYLAILAAIIPFLIILFYYARKDWRKYLAFIIGSLGWIVAFFLRLPIVTWVSMLENVWIIMILPSILAGLFEEFFRFLSVKFIGFVRKNYFLMAMGWSFAEVLVIYCLNIFYFLLINQPVSFIAALPGLVERFSATILHLALTVIVVKSLKNKRLLLLAILMHSMINISALVLLFLNFNVWIIEAGLIIISVWTYYFANSLKGELNGVQGKDIKKIKRR